MQNKKLPKSKHLRRIVFVLLSVSLILIAVDLLLSNRIVGYVKGSRLYYKSEVYIEVEYNIPFTGFGRSLGKVDVGGVKHILLTRKGQPQYLHVSFGWDGRDYVKEK